MKNRRLTPLLASASLFSALGLSALTSPSASAQPAPAPKMGKKGNMGRAKGARGKVPKKMLEKIETQMGKPLTEDQKTRLNAAYKARMEAQKTAQEKFADEVVAVTGLTADQVAELSKRGGKMGGAMGARKPV